MIQSDPVGYENGQNSSAEDGEDLTLRVDRPATVRKMNESDYNSDDENMVNNNVSKKSATDQASDHEERASPTKELFPNDQLSMQSFQSAIAQFTATAVANNMDNETVVKNLAVLQSALFTLQQQQFLQFQLIQHLQTELIKKNSEKLEPARSEADNDVEKRRPDSRSRESEMDERYDRGIIRPREMEREPIQVTPIAKLTNQDEILTYQNSFPLATSNVITDHDDSPMSGESNSLAMLEKKAQEVLDSASQGILSNNLMDELAFTNDNANSLARNDPALFKHRCRYCGKIFGSDSSLQIHVRSHTGERPYKCNICGSRFTTRGNLKVHFQRHSDKYPHIPMNPNPVPEHLDKYFPPLMPHEAIKEGPSSPDHLPVHLQSPFPGIDPRQRDMIPEYFLPRPPSMDYMNNAKELHSPNPVDLSQMPQKVVEVRAPSPARSPSPQPEENVEIKAEPMDPSPETDEDDDNDDHPTSLEPQTILTEGREEDYDDRCREASESTRKITRTSVNNNLSEKSKAASVSPASHSSSNSGSLYQDTVLDPTYFPSHHIPRSESTDSSWENFIEITSDASKLQDLVDNIDDKATEPNQCLVCKKTLSCRSALQMHYRVHTGDRPFRCKICGRSFTTKGNLKTHMSVHRIKPPMRTLHQCPVCHQKFSNIFVLQQHIRLHTGEQTDLTPEQIRAAEIREFDSPFGVRGIPAELLNQKRKEVSDEENDPRRREKSPKVPEVPPKVRFNPVEQQAEDLRALHLQKLSVRSRSRERFSRGSSPASQPPLEMKRMRSSSPPIMPKTPPVLRNQVSPIATPPTSDHFPPGRPHLPYGNPFLGMPQFPPFMGQPSFMRNMPTMLPHGATGLPQFGLFGVRGNTTTCNICFKTFACNSALDIHYRSHTKERPFKCTTCDRGFSTKGNMKQHLLTHKIRDGPGNSNSGDEESRQSSQSSQPETSAAAQQRPHHARSHHPMDDDDDDTDYTRGQYTMTKEADIKKWCNKLNEIPENIAAS